MLILDTNVLSALMLKAPDKQVVDWLDKQPNASVWITTITVFEIRFGIRILDSGRRKQTLQNAFDASLTEDFHNRILPFDKPSADLAAVHSAKMRSRGRPVEIRDIMITGIALAHRGSIVTRNTRHFEGAGVTLINPWQV